MTDDNTTTAIATAPNAKVKMALGAQLALTDPAILEAAVGTQRDALIALGEDGSLPDAMRQMIRNLAALSSPNRPGLEEVTGAWNIPRMAIAQPTSNSEAKPESAKNGDIYTTSGQLLERPWAGIPIHFSEENVNFPKTGGKNPVCSSIDSKLGSPFGECVKCPFLPFGKQNGGRGDQKQTDCYSNIVVIMLAADLSQVYKVQFGKTSRKAGAALLALARTQPMVWKQSYLLNTEKKTGDLGTYWVYQTQPTGKDNSADVQRLAEALFNLYNAERHLRLADWYARPARAPIAAAEAEGEFQGGALDAGITTTTVEVEPDFAAPPPEAKSANPSTTTSNKARSSAKPM